MVMMAWTSIHRPPTWGSLGPTPGAQCRAVTTCCDNGIECSSSIRGSRTCTQRIRVATLPASSTATRRLQVCIEATCVVRTNAAGILNDEMREARLVTAERSTRQPDAA